jgi:hypothetical protein
MEIVLMFSSVKLGWPSGCTGHYPVDILPERSGIKASTRCQQGHEGQNSPVALVCIIPNSIAVVGAHRIFTFFLPFRANGFPLIFSPGPLSVQIAGQSVDFFQFGL